jgi:hypothetical protein
VKCESDLLQIVFALCPSSSLASLLNGWQKQCDQDRDDRDHHQEFDQCKTSSSWQAMRAKWRELRLLHDVKHLFIEPG